MKAFLKRTTACILALCVSVGIIFETSAAVYATDYSSYSNEKVGWGLGLNKEHMTPSGNLPYEGFSLEEYDAYYVGDTSRKVIYLTFDCGYENGNTPAILDTLKQYDIKALFLVTEPFVRENPNLVKRMKAEGHLVGNHTTTHPILPDCDVERLQEEVRGVEDAVREYAGFELDKFLRPPTGAYSERALKVLQDMGYKTILWSLAWYDWDVNDQPSISTVVSKFKNYYHNGMIPLMHNTSSGDTAALASVIDYMLSEGFVFERLDSIFRSEPELSVFIPDMAFEGKTPHVDILTNSSGEQKIRYYDKNKNLIEAPKKPGVYYARVDIDETARYFASSCEYKFRITKTAPIASKKLQSAAETPVFTEEE